MHISIEHYAGQYPSFNVNLHTAVGKQPFLTIKGCRIVNGANGQFVSWPARKNDNTGKYFNYCYASEAFGLAVLEEAQKSMPKEDTRTHGERKKVPLAEMDDDIPF